MADNNAPNSTIPTPIVPPANAGVRESRPEANPVYSEDLTVEDLQGMVADAPMEVERTSLGDGMLEMSVAFDASGLVEGVERFAEQERSRRILGTTRITMTSDDGITRTFDCSSADFRFEPGEPSPGEPDSEPPTVVISGTAHPLPEPTEATDAASVEPIMYASEIRRISAGDFGEASFCGIPLSAHVIREDPIRAVTVIGNYVEVPHLQRMIEPNAVATALGTWALGLVGELAKLPDGLTPFSEVLGVRMVTYDRAVKLGLARVQALLSDEATHESREVSEDG